MAANASSRTSTAKRSPRRTDSAISTAVGTLGIRRSVSVARPPDAPQEWQAGGVPDEPRATGPLRPIDIATASVLAGVIVALLVIGWFLPHLGPVAALAVVPLGVVAHRHRFRALVAATFSAGLVSFLVAGTGTLTNVVECAIVGGLVGIARRRGWSFGTVMGVMTLIAPLLAAISVGVLL